MNVLIIEDEEIAFKNLKRILLDIDSTIIIVSWLQSVEQSINWFRTNDSPDLIFLDIQLSDDLSFKIFESVEIKTPVIFTTAFDEYAIKAFELNSIDYILKPIAKKNIETSLNKYHSSTQIPLGWYKKLIHDLNSSSIKPSYKERFLVNKADELIIISISKVSYFYIDDQTYIVLTNGDRYPINFTLEQLMELVNPIDFYRVNRQIIVSINSISKVTLWFKGKLKLHLTPVFQENVFVSRERSSNFKSWMGK